VTLAVVLISLSLSLFFFFWTERHKNCAFISQQVRTHDSSDYPADQYRVSKAQQLLKLPVYKSTHGLWAQKSWWVTYGGISWARISLSNVGTPCQRRTLAFTIGLRGNDPNVSDCDADVLYTTIKTHYFIICFSHTF
jgi:hypothetical protein